MAVVALPAAETTAPTPEARDHDERQIDGGQDGGTLGRYAGIGIGRHDTEAERGPEGQQHDRHGRSTQSAEDHGTPIEIAEWNGLDRNGGSGSGDGGGCHDRFLPQAQEGQDEHDDDDESDQIDDAIHCKFSSVEERNAIFPPEFRQYAQMGGTVVWLCKFSRAGRHSG